MKPDVCICFRQVPVGSDRVPRPACHTISPLTPNFHISHLAGVCCEHHTPAGYNSKTSPTNNTMLAITMTPPHVLLHSLSTRRRKKHLPPGRLKHQEFHHLIPHPQPAYPHTTNCFLVTDSGNLWTVSSSNSSCNPCCFCVWDDAPRVIDCDPRNRKSVPTASINSVSGLYSGTSPSATLKASPHVFSSTDHSKYQTRFTYCRIYTIISSTIISIDNTCRLLLVLP